MKSVKAKKILVTGSSGLIGSEVVKYFDKRGWNVVGVDNNMRKEFFGKKGDTKWNLSSLINNCKNFTHNDIDIRSRDSIKSLVKSVKPELIVHAAAQPSHDLASTIPYDDFEVNAVGTMNLLEGCRLFCPDASFIFLSTNKVYGDNPNLIKLIELEKRWDYEDPLYKEGINETMSIDGTTHSLFGVSKLSADIMVQEYGKYFGMNTCSLRGGCLTGPTHSAVELHGFLSYLIKCNLDDAEYTIYGYKGKQVRDNIHSYDVARCIDYLVRNPSPGSVFNLGGGRNNSISILEAFDLVSDLTGKPMKYSYSKNHRVGDHICYITDLSSLKSALKGWDITKNLDEIFIEIISAWKKRFGKI